MKNPVVVLIFFPGGFQKKPLCLETELYSKKMIVLQISQGKISMNSESGLEVPRFIFTKLYQNLAVGCTPLAFFLMTVLNLDPEE